MDRDKLKYTLLAIADRIFSACSTDDLEDALACFAEGQGVKLHPYKPIDLDDYEAIIPKIKRAFKPRSFVRRTKNTPDPVPENLVKMVQLNVPLTMDLTHLSQKERMILLQNLDMPVLMTCHQPKRTKSEFSCMAKIGIQMSFLHNELKSDPEIKQYMHFYNPQTGYFMHNIGWGAGSKVEPEVGKGSRYEFPKNISNSVAHILPHILLRTLKEMSLIFVPFGEYKKPP